MRSFLQDTSKILWILLRISKQRTQTDEQKRKWSTRQRRSGLRDALSASRTARTKLERNGEKEKVLRPVLPMPEPINEVRPLRRQRDENWNSSLYTNRGSTDFSNSTSIWCGISATKVAGDSSLEIRVENLWDFWEFVSKLFDFSEAKANRLKWEMGVCGVGCGLVRDRVGFRDRAV